MSLDFWTSISRRESGCPAPLHPKDVTIVGAYEVIVKSQSLLVHREAWHAPLKLQDYIGESPGVLKVPLLCHSRISCAKATLML